MLIQGQNLRIEVLNARHLKPVDVLSSSQDNSETNKMSTLTRTAASGDLFTTSTTNLSQSNNPADNNAFSTFPRRSKTPSRNASMNHLDQILPLPSVVEMPAPTQLQNNDDYVSLREMRCFPTSIGNSVVNGQKSSRFIKSKLDAVRLSVQVIEFNIYLTLFHLRC